ncbi:MAG: DUF4174 domain-containing protein [Dinoroseobacter sp.]|nr:DUF4174 domain-containing protein [Dinoroseobacter sp.]
MRYVFSFVLASLLALVSPVLAQDSDAEAVPELQILQADSIDLNDFLWVARPLIVFADSPADPRFSEQLELIERRPTPLLERDVVVILDSDRSSESALRTQLRPRGFMLVIMGKDGEIELRKPAPWNVREITRTIDKMPLRQQEIRAGE